MLRQTSPALVLLLATLAPAAAWPQFRGPNAIGTSTSTNLPVEFNPHKNVAWKATLPVGNSSPVLTPDRIFLTGHEGDRLFTLCLDRATPAVVDGKIYLRTRHTLYCFKKKPPAE